LTTRGSPEDVRKKARGGSETPRLIKDKSKISKAFSANERRGTIHFDGHRIVPVVSPLAVPGGRLTVRATFEGDQAFLEWWKVDDPGNSHAFEVAQNAYNTARKLARTAYRRFKDQATSEPANLIDIKALANNPNPPSDEQTSSSARPTTESVRSEDGSINQALKSNIREWLVATFKLPIAPGNDVLDPVTRYCKDDDGFLQFKEACANLKPRSWIVFVKMASLCAEHRREYQSANTMAAGSTGEKQRPRWAEDL